jgi:hypothetical protein
MINLTFLKHGSQIKKVLDIQAQSSILSNLFLDFSNLNFLYVNLEVNVSKLSLCFVDFTSF